MTMQQVAKELGLTEREIRDALPEDTDAAIPITDIAEEQVPTDDEPMPF